MENFKTIDEIVNFSHKALHEDDFGQADTHVFQFRRKRLHF